jgi:hypothetical protein
MSPAETTTALSVRCAVRVAITGWMAHECCGRQWVEWSYARASRLSQIRDTQKFHDGHVMINNWWHGLYWRMTKVYGSQAYSKLETTGEFYGFNNLTFLRVLPAYGDLERLEKCEEILSND